MTEKDLSALDVLKKMIEYIGDEDLDDNDYGGRWCHWCGAGEERTPEYFAVEAQHQRRRQELWGDNSKRMLVIPTVGQGFLPWPDKIWEVKHKEDCLWKLAKKVVNEQG